MDMIILSGIETWFILMVLKKPLLVCRIENDYALRTYSDFKN